MERTPSPWLKLAKLTLGAEPAEMGIKVLEALSLEALPKFEHGAAFRG